MEKFLSAARGKHIFKGSTILIARRYKSDAKLVNTAVDIKTGIAVISINRPPANCLNRDLFNGLTYELRKLEQNKCRGVILTSELPSIFSAGIDFKELYKPDLKRLAALWHSFHEFWITLYGSKLPTASAINGACPGAGGLIAISCEYRVFVEGNHQIGFNETMLGFAPPKWGQDVFIDIVGHRQAEISLMQSRFYTLEEALKIGIVDELATDKADAIAKCEKYIASYNNIPPEARSATKTQLRSATMSWLNKNRELDTNAFISFIEKPEFQMNLERYIENLEKK